MAHWLDSSLLINAWNDAYGYDFAPGFWEFLEEGFGDGRFRLCDAISQEIGEKDDDLNRWVRALPAGSIVLPNVDVQHAYGPVADYVNGNGFQNRRSFLDKGDGWLIAHAQVDQGIIVSQETRAGVGTVQAKIPNVGDQFGVRTITRAQLLRDFGVKLVRG